MKRLILPFLLAVLLAACIGHADYTVFVSPLSPLPTPALSAFGQSALDLRAHCIDAGDSPQSCSRKLFQLTNPDLLIGPGNYADTGP